MKTKERHHLKENELGSWRGRRARRSRRGAAKPRPWSPSSRWSRRSRSAISAGANTCRPKRTRCSPRRWPCRTRASVRRPRPGTPAGGLYFPTERERSQAALTKFKIAADAYPSTDAGIFARYQEGADLAGARQHAQAAIAAYQQVIEQSGDGIYGQMARLGLAEAQARAGQYDQAITTFKDLAQRKDGPLPVDGILMQLGRTYLDAGKRADAQQTFNRLVEEYPESPFTGDARKEIETLKKST